MLRALGSMTLVLVLSLLALPRADARIATEPIREVIHAALPQIRTCTARCVGCASGDYRVAIRFTIESSGAVSEAEVTDSNAPNPALGECIAEVVRNLSFPSLSGRPGDSVRVNYPFLIHVV